MIYTLDDIEQLKFDIGKHTRIVSLVPSLTELLFDLGLHNAVVGITKFCIHPETWYRTKERVGGTKNVDIEKVLKIQPDLIIANKEENVKDQVEVLAENINVLLTDINTIEEALMVIDAIGRLLGKETASDSMIRNFKDEVCAYPSNQAIPKEVCYLIWQNPWMTVGGDTYINDTLKFGGFKNVYQHLYRYPVIEDEAFVELVKSGTCAFLLSSEPYPFRQKHIDVIKTYNPEVVVILVDGEIFSWYGSKLLKLPSYISELRKLLN